MKKLLPLTLAAFAVVLTWAGLSWSAIADNASSGKWNSGDLYLRMNGEHIHRFTLTPDNSTAEDNLTASGGTAVAYTLFGRERLCYEAVGTDAWVEVVAAASMTAAGAKARLVKADQSGDVVCDTLAGTLKVSALCTAAGPCIVKAFEITGR